MNTAEECRVAQRQQIEIGAWKSQFARHTNMKNEELRLKHEEVTKLKLTLTRNEKMARRERTRLEKQLTETKRKLAASEKRCLRWGKNYDGMLEQIKTINESMKNGPLAEYQVKLGDDQISLECNESVQSQPTSVRSGPLRIKKESVEQLIKQEEGSGGRAPHLPPSIDLVSISLKNQKTKAEREEEKSELSLVIEQ